MIWQASGGRVIRRINRLWGSPGRRGSDTHRFLGARAHPPEALNASGVAALGAPPAGPPEPLAGAPAPAGGDPGLPNEAPHFFIAAWNCARVTPAGSACGPAGPPPDDAPLPEEDASVTPSFWRQAVSDADPAGGPPGASGRSAGSSGTQGGTSGTLAFLSGSTLYVTNSAGNTIRVETTSGTSVTKTVKATVSAIRPGEDVTVTGSTSTGGAITAGSISVGALTGAGFASAGKSTAAAASGSTLFGAG